MVVNVFPVGTKSKVLLSKGHEENNLLKNENVDLTIVLLCQFQRSVN